MFYINKYYYYTNYLLSNYLISKINIFNNFDHKIKNINLIVNYKLKQKNWLVALMFLFLLITSNVITYNKIKILDYKKQTKNINLNLKIKFNKKKVINFFQNSVFFLFPYNIDFTILKIKKYIKDKAFNNFKLLLLKNLFSYPQFKMIFKYEKEYFFIQKYFKIFLNITFYNNNNNNNFLNNLHYLKLLKFPIQRK